MRYILQELPLAYRLYSLINVPYFSICLGSTAGDNSTIISDCTSSVFKEGEEGGVGGDNMRIRLGDRR